VTFSDPEIEDFLARNFACAKASLDPGLFLGSASRHSEELLAQFPEGAGGGNVRCIFCTQDGRIVSEVKGFWRPPRFREEADLALRMASASKEAIQAMHVERAAALDAERAGVERERAALTEPEPKPSPWARRIAALNRMARSHRESREVLLVPVEEHLRRVEDEVWTKGKVG